MSGMLSLWLRVAQRLLSTQLYPLAHDLYLQSCQPVRPMNETEWRSVVHLLHCFPLPQAHLRVSAAAKRKVAALLLHRRQRVATRCLHIQHHPQPMHPQPTHPHRLHRYQAFV